MLPAAPSPLPLDKIGRLGIACPAGSQAQSFDGGPVTVHFGAPVPSGGQQPVTVGCTPHSGSAFNIGSTDVTCGASDALQQTASCAFRVTVRGPPKLAVSRFLAFGDSITAGVVSPPTGGTRLDSFNAYPSRLQRGLASRYVTQDILVINAGKGGEHVTFAFGRFNAELMKHRPEVLLLMEGTSQRSGPDLRVRPRESGRNPRANGGDCQLRRYRPVHHDHRTSAQREVRSSGVGHQQSHSFHCGAAGRYALRRPQPSAHRSV